MSNWIKLLLPLALGGIAAGVNWAIMNRIVAPETFVVANADVAAGEKLTEGMLSKRELSGEAAKLLQSAVPWKDVNTLVLNRRVARSLAKDDLLLWRDLEEPNELPLGEQEDALTLSLEGVAVVEQLLPIGKAVTFVIAKSQNETSTPEENADRFEKVGPFQLLSVGPRMTRIEDQDDAGSGTRAITIAIPRKPDDPMTPKLLNAISASEYGKSPIVAVIIHGPDSKPISAESPAVKAAAQTSDTK